VKKEIHPAVFGVVIAALVAIIVFAIVRSGQPPTSNVTEHTQLRAPAGLPQPPWAKNKSPNSNAPGTTSAPAIPAPE
jgi:hypothetical protein